MRLSFDGSANGQHTLQDLADFIGACQHLGMPLAATLVTGGLSGFKAKLSGSGALRSLTAEWDEHSTPPVGATPAPVRPFVPGLGDPPTAPMPTTSPATTPIVP